MSAQEKFVHLVHEYERSKDNKTVYRCIHPKCTHYQRRALLEGKEATCSKCKNTFILTWRQLRNKRPVCDFCTRSPKAATLRNIRDLVNGSLDNLPEEIKETLLDKTLE